MKYLFLLLTFVTYLFLPVVVLAASPEESCGQLNSQVENFAGGESVGGALAAHCVTPGVGISRAITLGLGIAASVAAIFIIIGGYRYVTSSGNAEAATSAKKTIMWAAIGLVVIIMAGAIIRIVANFVTGK